MKKRSMALTLTTALIMNVMPVYTSGAGRDFELWFDED